MQKKDLILFYPSFERGGVTNILQNLVNEENSKEFNIHIISSKNFLKSNLKKNKSIIFYPVLKKINIPLIPQRFITALNGMIVLNSLLKDKRKNVVVHSMQSNVAAIIVCFFKNIKIVIRNSEDPIHSTINSENIFFGFIAFCLKLLFYNFTDGIVTNSKGSAKSLRYFVFNKKKIYQIYNPYLKKINKKNYLKKKYIINIGRLRKQKDHKTLLLAFQIFLKKKKDYKLIILGHGNLEANLKKLSKKLKISNKVIFKGWTKDTLTYLKKSKIFVLSSVYEGLGNVLIDAINFNVPCISTNCKSGPSEILLNGKGGYLVKIRKPYLLAEKMLLSIDNYNVSLSKNARAKSKLDRFYISKNSKKYFTYLKSFYNFS